MGYYFSKTIDGGFDAVVDRAIAALKLEGFGVLTDIDVRKTLKDKIGADFHPYCLLLFWYLGRLSPGASELRR